MGIRGFGENLRRELQPLHVKIAAGALGLAVALNGAYAEQLMRGENPCERSGDVTSIVTAPVCQAVLELNSLFASQQPDQDPGTVA